MHRGDPLHEVLRQAPGRVRRHADAVREPPGGGGGDDARESAAHGERERERRG